LTELLKSNEGSEDYIDDFFNGKFHITQIITCPYRSLYPKESYQMTLGRIFDLGVKQFYREKGYEVNVRLEMPITDRVCLVGDIDLLRRTANDVEIIEVKLSDFSEYTVSKGLLQVFAYGQMYKHLFNVEPKVELWCFGLRSFQVFRPQFGKQTWARIIDRALYCWTYIQKYNSEPRIPSRLDCKYCEEKFNCRLAYKKAEDLELH